MEERRKDERIALYKLGVIRFGSGLHEIPCAMIDVSERGASIELATAFDVPQTFELAINGEDGTHFCKGVWVNAKILGVSFL